jgi:hypothetical protein
MGGRLGLGAAGATCSLDARGSVSGAGTPGSGSGRAPSRPRGPAALPTLSLLSPGLMLPPCGACGTATAPAPAVMLARLPSLGAALTPGLQGQEDEVHDGQRV